MKGKTLYLFEYIFLGTAVFGLFLKDSSVSSISVTLMMVCAYFSGDIHRMLKRGKNRRLKKG